MINLEKLAPILKAYKADFQGNWKDEIYKWQAVKWFQDNWDINADNFGDMFNYATEKHYNLLSIAHSFPRGMIIDFAKADDSATREMFRTLFDDSVKIVDRIEAFQASANAMLAKYGDGRWKNHYQNTNAISTYLWLKFPNKYYIYRYEYCKEIAQELNENAIPKRDGKAKNVSDCYSFYDEIRNILKNDSDIKHLIQQSLAPDCYEDSELVTATVDFVYYFSTRYNKWGPLDYTPGLSVQDWQNLLHDPSVFSEHSLQIVARMKDIGGHATCKQLSTKYGEESNFYNSGSSTLAQRIAEKTHCPIYETDDDKKKWWPILYTGRQAKKNEDGGFVWRLRPELQDALDLTDLSGISLYAKAVPAEGTPVRSYWWLTANPSIWSLASMKTGDEQSYTLYNDNGHKRRMYQNFLDVKPGDDVICYESTPALRISALGQITKASNGSEIYFKKTEDLMSPISFSEINECPELQNMEFKKQAYRGSLFKLTKDEHDVIMDIIREANPIRRTEKTDFYSDKNFLSEVYMDEQDYKRLRSLLEEKKNVILQGAPGVGKTFAAKRLAYSIMGEKDNSRIKLIQFHQNYSYEDFIMGYRPNEKGGFQLEYGVFYRFCKMAESDPDPQRKYFLIIDEINRGNLSKIFGELLMLMENRHRNDYASLAYTGESFSVPDNLYIVGMMNTADRSIAMIDHALRRRFGFFTMKPAFGTKAFVKYLDKVGNAKLNKLISAMRELNEDITKSIGKGFVIGHSYFCEKDKKDLTDDLLDAIVDFEIIPTLEEYWYDDSDKVDYWIKQLKSAIQ